MNRGIYRLVASSDRGTLVPTHEATRARGKRGRIAGGGRVAMFSAAMMLGAGSGQGIAAGPKVALIPSSAANGRLLPGTLPNCPGGVCGGGPVVTQGSLTYTVSGKAGLISQGSNLAVATWNSFDIAGDASVRVSQPSSSSQAYFNIRGGQYGYTQIEGALNANGQVYLLNQNGILFARGATVNVATLLASSQQLMTGTAGIASRGVTDGGAAFDCNQAGCTGAPTGFVRVEQGASIKADGGAVYLFAPNVTNEGSISARDGQVILGAGEQIFLAASTDPKLRGILIEVNNPSVPDSDRLAPDSGIATNSGSIDVGRGNATIAGLAVNQLGRISATTSVALNGSIYLKARDNPTLNTSDPAATMRAQQRAGTLWIGNGSVTEVLPDSTDAATLPDTNRANFAVSQISASGEAIRVENGATVVATGGTIDMAARTAFDSSAPSSYAATSGTASLQIDDGALLSVAGATDGVASVQRNIVQVELRGAVVANSPALRDGPLYGQKVWVDLSQPNPLLDLKSAGYLDANGNPITSRSVSELLSNGGTISLASDGETVVRPGAVLDVSGGSVTYMPGLVYTSKIGFMGRFWDISTAPANLPYDKIFDSYTQTNAKWGASQTFAALGGRSAAGYVEGHGAGTVSVTTRDLYLGGTIRAAAGPTALVQRSNAPTGGTLVVNTGSDQVSDTPWAATSVVTTFEAPALDTAFGEALSDELRRKLVIAANKLDQGGLATLKLETAGDLAIGASAALQMQSGGGIALTSDWGKVDVAADLRAYAGGISIKGFDAVHVSGQAQLSAAGVWTNDTLAQAVTASTSAVRVNGGSISIASQQGVSIDVGSVLDVSGGGWLATGAKLTGGNAGSISLAARASKPSDIDQNSIPADAPLEVAGSLRGIALGQGGQLSVSAAVVRIDGAGGGPAIHTAADGTTTLSSDFFNTGGFQSYGVSGQDGLVVASGARIAPVETSLNTAVAPLQRLASGASVADAASAIVLPEASRAGSSVTLTAGTDALTRNAYLTVEQGATIDAGTRGSVSLNAGRGLWVDGTVTAAGGTVSLNLGGPSALYGYDPAAAIGLGSHAVLDVSGKPVTQLNAVGRTVGTVLDGGTVTLDAKFGSILADVGSSINARGGSGVLDVVNPDGSTGREVAGAGGTVSLSATEGIVSHATMDAHGGDASASGGRLLVQMNARIGGDATTPYPDAAREIVLVATNADLPTLAITAGVNLPDAGNGKGYVVADTVTQGGFDWVYLNASDRVTLGDKVSLTVRSGLAIDTPVLAAAGGATASVASSYVNLLQSNTQLAAATASGGSGKLTVSGARIDVTGQIATQGIGELTLDSTGDVNLQGYLPTTDLSATRTIGRLDAGGALVVRAAQLAPASLTDFTLSAADSIRIEAQGSSVFTSSVAGALTIVAPQIVQAGVVRAPFGQIAFDASDSLTLAAGSVTSVSAEGNTLRFGEVQNGTSWTFVPDPNQITTTTYTAPPTGSVSLGGKTVAIEDGARVDLSGGGDLKAWEFVPSGKLGLNDFLSRPGMFAIIPSGPQPTFAPDDRDARVYQQGISGAQVSAFGNVQSVAANQIAPGQQIYLAGNGEIPAGYYTVLPAHYALLPGAFAIQVGKTASDLRPGQGSTSYDGSMSMAGYFARQGGAVKDSRWSTFTLWSTDQVARRGEYHELLASSFYPQQASGSGADVPQLPSDAGTLSVLAQQSLALGGDIELEAATGGKAGSLEISAPKIEVLGAGKTADDGYVAVSSERLSGMGLASLTLGATHGAGDALVVGAGEVRIDNAGTALGAGEVLVAATDRIELADGAQVQDVAQPALAVPRQGTIAAKAPVTRSVTIGSDSVFGDGVLLDVATGDLLTVQRTNTTISRNAVLSVGSGAKLASSGSVLLDSTGNVLLAPDAGVSAAQIGISAGSVALGDVPASTDTGAPTGGLVIGKAMLDQLSSANLLAVRGYGSLDFYGSAILGELDAAGHPVIKQLVLDTPAIRGFDGAAGESADVSITAGSIAIRNHTGNDTSVDPVALPAGGLRLSAVATGKDDGSGTITIDPFDKTVDPTLPADVAISGFGSVDMRAARALVLGGANQIAISQTLVDSDGNTSFRGTTTVTAPAVLVASTADIARDPNTTLDRANLATDGDLRFAALGTAPVQTGVGGRTMLEGYSVELATPVIARSGEVRVHATGGDVRIAAPVDLSGTDTAVLDASVSTYGGSFTANSDAGRVVLAAAGGIDVSASAGATGSQARAGSITLNAAGDVVLVGSVRGQGAAQGGSIALQGAHILTDETQDANDLSGALARVAGQGFGYSQRYVSSSGDLDMAATDRITAQTVVLQADGGDLNMAGSIDASGVKGGSVTLAGYDVTLADSARIDASASGAGQKGGDVLIGAATPTTVVALSPEVKTVQGRPTTTSRTVNTVTGKIVTTTTTETDTLTLTTTTVTTNDLTATSHVQVDAGARIDVHGGSAVADDPGRTLGGTVDFRASRIAGGNGDIAAVNQGAPLTVTGAAHAYIEAVDVIDTTTTTTTERGRNALKTTLVETYDKAGHLLSSVTTVSDPVFTRTSMTSPVLKTAVVTQAMLQSAFDSFNLDAGYYTTNAPADRSDIELVRGIEIRSGSPRDEGNVLPDMNVASGLAGIDLNAIHGSDGSRGFLTLRSPGRLAILGSLSDGFVIDPSTKKASLSAGDSWNLRLVSGADVASANPLALNANADGNHYDLNGNQLDGSLTLGQKVVVRTGTGNIDVAVANDLTLGNTAVIYTAGRTGDPADLAGTKLSTQATDATAHDGGSLSIYAGGDIFGYVTSSYGNTDWLFREATGDPSGSQQLTPGWWARFDKFAHGVGALAGGDVAIAAGRDVNDLSVSASSNGFVLDYGTATQRLVRRGTGDLTIEAGRDINGGVADVANGSLNVDAAGAIGISQMNSKGYRIELGDAAANLSARNDIVLESANSPTAERQQGALPSALGGKSFFLNYGGSTALTALSARGAIQLGTTSSASAADPYSPDVLPPTVRLYAPLGDISQGPRPMTLAPDVLGQLELLSGGDISLNVLAMADIFGPGSNPLTAASGSAVPAWVDATNQGASGTTTHGDTPVHVEDPNPVKVYAVGDISGVTGAAASLVLPKAAQIVAGGDIRNLSVLGQNVNPADITEVRAGGSIVYDTPLDPTGLPATNFGRIEIGGPGVVLVQAGRDVLLGNARGIIGAGNLDNAALSDQGASVVVIAGVSGAPDYTGFLAHYVDPAAGASSAPYAAMLVDFVAGDAASGQAAGTRHGEAAGDAASAWQAFLGLSPARREEFARQVFFAELKRVGTEATTTTHDYNAGYTAIATLFPTGSHGTGNIDLTASKIVTQHNGDIELLVPGGVIDGGLVSMSAALTNTKRYTNAEAGVEETPESNLGIMTFNGGRILAYADGDISVNSSRVMTLGGNDAAAGINSDVMMWSSNGSIDAGRGSKTTSFAPPPVIRVDSQGNVHIDISGTVTGSGIGELVTIPGRAPGELALFAPRGDIDAGEAGINASGNLILGAVHVIGADNISVGGNVVGAQLAPPAPVVTPPPMVNALAATSAGVADQAEEEDRRRKRDRSSILNVEVIGVGDQ
jgi:filamentous hemagglutinin family protein